MLTFLSLSASATSDIPDWFAVVMGIGTVFVGLLSIIIICVITGAICGVSKRRTAKSSGRAEAPAKTAENIKNRSEVLAAVCAACAEDMGTDVNALKVISFKKL